MKYETIRDSLETGDLVLFAGEGFISRAISFFTKSRWSHIGVVVRKPGIDQLLLWESTTLSNVKDALDGKLKRGVQTVLLDDRVRTYKGEIAIRTLDVGRTPDMIDAMMQLRDELRHKPYEKNKKELLFSALDGIFGTNTVADLSSVFCSELVAELYQRMELLSTELPSNEYTPADFGDRRRMKLLKGKLTPEMHLTRE